MILHTGICNSTEIIKLVKDIVNVGLALDRDDLMGLSAASHTKTSALLRKHCTWARMTYMFMNMMLKIFFFHGDMYGYTEVTIHVPCENSLLLYAILEALIGVGSRWFAHICKSFCCIYFRLYSEYWHLTPTHNKGPADFHNRIAQQLPLVSACLRENNEEICAYKSMVCIGSGVACTVGSKNENKTTYILNGLYCMNPFTEIRL